MEERSKKVSRCGWGFAFLLMKIVAMKVAPFFRREDKKSQRRWSCSLIQNKDWIKQKQDIDPEPIPSQS